MCIRDRGYTIEGEEPPQQQPQAAAIPETTGQQKEREHMSEQFSIMIGLSLIHI